MKITIRLKHDLMFDKLAFEFDSYLLEYLVISLKMSLTKKFDIQNNLLWQKEFHLKKKRIK